MQAMSILGRVLLSFLVLVACQGDMVTPSAHPLWTNMLKESITLLEKLQQTEVSCNQMNVTNIFADYKGGDITETLCKAATVARECRSCHRRLEGISDNLLGLLWGHRMEHKRLCPVAPGSTTSLKNFLEELHKFLQKEFKSLVKKPPFGSFVFKL